MFTAKVYMDYLSKALATEYESEHIIVQSVTPGMVESKLSKQYKATAGSALEVKCPDYVRATLKTVGREEATNGHPKHKIIYNVLAFVEAFLGPKSYSRQLMSFNKGLKEKGEKIFGSSTVSGDNNNKVA